ncbi:phosphoacetylglucosamine mutase-like isoform X2 [Ptychodera flava]|uniref:phosphoacetylglucosamine mutase-like isoform X2 n=1 Tax=Ptychodera flava TaxID=63121 RepID=UPI00396A3EA4
MANEWSPTQARRGTAKHPRKDDKVFTYGTAGFRARADTLDPVLYRSGLVAVLRSMSKKAAVGVMITASHNPECDNGVKLIDPMGEMLQVSWEKYVSDIVNVRDDEISDALQKIIDEEKIDTSQAAYIITGRDTRPSSCSLSQSLIDGVVAMGAEYKDYGLLTTPQLHYMVRCHNTGGRYGEPLEEGYYKKLSKAFLQLRQKIPIGEGGYKNEIFLDGANGVGALKVQQLLKHLDDALKITVCNDGSQGKLNENCGADYVKLHQGAPKGLIPEAGAKCISFDGDADRILYFYKDGNGKFQLLDGDKIATLIASFIKELVSEVGLSLNLGVVQTAYANGSSTRYLEDEMKVPVACVPTGVKHLHRKAEEFDVGIYFEANGHGTVLFSQDAEEKIRAASKDGSLSSEKRLAAESLSSLIDLTNQTVGDALADMLLVETILFARHWDVSDWNSAYTDLPNRQLKVKVKDRTIIHTTDAERRTTSPAGLQDAIDELVKKYTKARSFVRPSGTEDIVRVYAEADTQENTDMLAYEVSLKVFQLAQGIGDPPQPPAGK